MNNGRPLGQSLNVNYIKSFTPIGRLDPGSRADRASSTAKRGSGAPNGKENARKSDGLLRQGKSMKVAFIDVEKALYPLRILFGPIPRREPNSGIGVGIEGVTTGPSTIAMPSHQRPGIV